MNPIELEIRQALKKWITEYRPPIDGRSRLLRAASSFDNKVEKKLPIGFGVLPNELLSWAIVYSMDRGIASLRLVS